MTLALQTNLISQFFLFCYSFRWEYKALALLVAAITFPSLGMPARAMPNPGVVAIVAVKIEVNHYLTKAQTSFFPSLFLFVVSLLHIPST
jgi:hypothetical protein